MGQSKVGKRRNFLPPVLALLTFAVLGALMFPLVAGLEFRDGSGVGPVVDKRGLASVTGCESRFYGLEYTCAATVRWEEGAGTSQPVLATVISSRALGGDVQVTERKDRPNRKRPIHRQIVPADHPFGTALGGWILVLAIFFCAGASCLVAWRVEKLRKPLPEVPAENNDLRAAQIARGKTRRKRRKTTG